MEQPTTEPITVRRAVFDAERARVVLRGGEVVTVEGTRPDVQRTIDALADREGPFEGACAERPVRVLPAGPVHVDDPRARRALIATAIRQAVRR